MKHTINPLEHATEILQGVQKGVLLTTKNKDRVNSMTISWGALGIEWGKPLFTALFVSIASLKNSSKPPKNSA